jgi:hypothetical protein
MSKKTLALALVAAAATCTAHAETTRTLRATLSADAVASFAVENLAGTMTVIVGDTAAVEAVATVHADDDEVAGTVAFEQVRGREGRPTLRVRYPVADHHTFRYPGAGSSSMEYDGRRVKVSSTSGVLLWADVEVRVPRHLDDAAFYNLVGELRAEGLEGRVRLDTASADITARSLAGKVAADSGSGDVHAEMVAGTFACDTGSGDCVISGFDGDALTCDTGSGDITVRNAAGRRLKADTGSGNVRVENADVEEVGGDTGSGDIELQLGGARVRRISADTGSGDVTIRLPADASFELDADVGSGDIVSRFADAQPVIHNRTVTGYRRADGRIRIAVDTGSGDVTVAPR